MRDIVVEAQRDIVLDFGPITRRSQETGLLVPIDLSLGGTKLWFTVKVNRSDSYALAKIAKTYVAAVSSDGIIVTLAQSTDEPNGTVTIPRANLDYVERQSWYWDLLIEEPGGRRSTVDSGTFKVILPVSNPA